MLRNSVFSGLKIPHFLKYGRKGQKSAKKKCSNFAQKKGVFGGSKTLPRNRFYVTILPWKGKAKESRELLLVRMETLKPKELSRLSSRMWREGGGFFWMRITKGMLDKREP